MSELENIENEQEVETIPTDNENVEQSTGEVSGEVSGEVTEPDDNSDKSLFNWWNRIQCENFNDSANLSGFPINYTIKQLQPNITQSSEVLRGFMKWFNDWQFVELVFMVIVLSMLLSCRLLGFM